MFVHGVATRGDAGYAETVANRDALFRAVLFKGTATDIHTPLWGDIVPRIDRRVFDTHGAIKTFSLGSGAFGAGLGGGMSDRTAGDPTGPSLGDVAAQNEVVALDALFVQLIDHAEELKRSLTSAEVAAFGRAADEIATGRHTLLKGAVTDRAIAGRLMTGGDRSLGILNPFMSAASAISDRIRNTASTIGFGAVRERVSPAIALFLGDVLVYLREGGIRDRIRATVREALKTAHAASMAGRGPLIVIGHSLGGVIACDMLQDPSSGLPPDLRIDALLTVGSQPGLFQTVGALGAGPIDGARAPRPACVRRWLNVFDPIDPLAFTAASVFDDVQDLAFDSVTGLVSAHTTYFKRPQFHARCRSRLTEFGLL